MARDIRLKARRAAARGIPPRLPADEVEVIPFFGRTWYEHGVDYWFRRVLAVLFASFGLALAIVAEIAALNIASGMGSAVARWAWRVGWAALLVGSLVRPMRLLRAASLARRAGWLTAPDPEPPRRTGVLAVLIRMRDTLARVVVVIGMVWFFGWFVYFMIITLQPEYGEEAFARRRLQLHHRVATACRPPTDDPPRDAAGPRRGIEPRHDRSDHSGDDHDLRPRRRPDRGLPRPSTRHHTARRGRGDPPHARL